MQAVVSPGFLKGTVRVPASKSMMQRACAAALLHKGTTIINDPGTSDDDKAALSIIQELGAEIIEQTEQRIVIKSTGKLGDADAIHCGESGLSARLFTPIATLSGGAIRIDGKGGLLQRPMKEFETILPAVGVKMKDFNGYLPFAVHGPIVPKSMSIDGSISSQFLTGILFALSASAREPVTVTVHNLKSKPYIDMTLDVLARFGKSVTHTNYEEFYIDPAQFSFHDEVEMNIEGDWSSAVFWLVSGAMNGAVTVENLNLNSRQADAAVIDVLHQIRTNMTAGENSLSIARSELRPFQFDATDCPDLYPILAVLAAYCEGSSSIKGLHRLKHKESDREKSIVDMLTQLGVKHSMAEDALLITGQQQLNACTINGYNDHRIVMAAAIAALRASGPVTITNAEAVAKSYPDFFQHLASLGGECTLNA